MTTWNIEGLTDDELDVLQMAISARVVRLEDALAEARRDDRDAARVAEIERRHAAALAVLRKSITNARAVGGKP